jgi:hypothetical protein
MSSIDSDVYNPAGRARIALGVVCTGFCNKGNGFKQSVYRGLTGKDHPDAKA